MRSTWRCPALLHPTPPALQPESQQGHSRAWPRRLRTESLASSSRVSAGKHSPLREKERRRFNCPVVCCVAFSNNRKSVTLLGRSSPRASHRGAVIPHPLRQGLLPSDLPPRAIKRESVAACHRSIFLLSFREH